MIKSMIYRVQTLKKETSNTKKFIKLATKIATK